MVTYFLLRSMSDGYVILGQSNAIGAELGKMKKNNDVKTGKHCGFNDPELRVDGYVVINEINGSGELSDSSVHSGVSGDSGLQQAEPNGGKALNLGRENSISRHGKAMDSSANRFTAESTSPREATYAYSFA